MSAVLFPVLAESAPELFAFERGLMEVMRFSLTGEPLAPTVTTCSNLQLAQQFATRFSWYCVAVVFHDDAEVSWFLDGKKMDGRFPAEQFKVKRSWQLGMQFARRRVKGQSND